MKKVNVLLLVVLAAQVGLMFFTRSGKQHLGAYVANEPLLQFQVGDIDTLVIKGPDKKSVLLKKEDTHWLMPGFFNAPAGTPSVNSLLERLASLKKGLPVATSKEAAGRFKVAGENFERDIVLKKGDKTVAELLIGSSPLFRKSYVRLPASPTVSTAKITLNDAGIAAGDWLNKSLLGFDEKGLTAFSVGSLKLTKKDKQWLLVDLAAAETMDSGKVQNVISQLSGMRVETVLGLEDKAEYGLKKPLLSCRLQRGDDEEVWQIGKGEKEKFYVLKSSKQAFYFKVADWQMKPLLELRRTALLKQGPTTSEANKAKTPGGNVPDSSASPTVERPERTPQQ